jgi:hypothetical protein
MPISIWIWILWIWNVEGETWSVTLISRDMGTAKKISR